MFPDYSTFKTYHRLSNWYATLGDTTRLPIEVICTTVYTLNGRTILTCNALHITDLQDPLYSLCKHRQRPGCGFYYSYKDGSYPLFPDFILQVKDSYDNIDSYRSLCALYQGPIDYIEPRSTSSTAMAMPSGRPSTITPEPKKTITPHHSIRWGLHLLSSSSTSIYRHLLSTSTFSQCYTHWTQQCNSTKELHQTALHPYYQVSS